MKNIKIFIRKFPFLGGKIFSIFEQACFRNVNVTCQTLLPVCRFVCTRNVVVSELRMDSTILVSLPFAFVHESNYAFVHESNLYSFVKLKDIFHWRQIYPNCFVSSEKGSTLKGRNLLPLGANSFLLG